MAIGAAGWDDLSLDELGLQSTSPLPPPPLLLPLMLPPLIAAVATAAVLGTDSSGTTGPFPGPFLLLLPPTPPTPLAPPALVLLLVPPPPAPLVPPSVDGPEDACAPVGPLLVEWLREGEEASAIMTHPRGAALRPPPATPRLLLPLRLLLPPAPPAPPPAQPPAPPPAPSPPLPSLPAVLLAVPGPSTALGAAAAGAAVSSRARLTGLAAGGAIADGSALAADAGTDAGASTVSEPRGLPPGSRKSGHCLSRWAVPTDRALAAARSYSYR